MDIADGQTVTNLDISDYLPGNLQFVQVVSTSPAATCGTPAQHHHARRQSGLHLRFGDRHDGHIRRHGAFPFYVPLNDAGSNPVINASTGDDVQCINQAGALGDWTPLDPRDLGGVDNASAGGSGDPPEHILGCKSIAIQKSVANLTDSTNSPGDVLEYTLNFQVSDFFAFQNVIIDDLASDGQHFQSSFAPTLQVKRLHRRLPLRRSERGPGRYPNNDVTISGDVLNNANLIPTGNSEADTSAPGANIAQGSLEKTIYAKNGVACAPQPCSAVRGRRAIPSPIACGTHPTSDFEQFSMEDFVPLPVFSATEVTP
ncbi:MAG: hypothetical protein IPO15_04800 [Anaerolineae bacterium]|uniref:hypothetical protein n=1 Tax=Candidatus Amarolinea dominans TaxID=3140696 RepID=UPI003134FCF5|nr:hypothetical protein [Anaerolineae bacterium]